MKKCGLCLNPGNQAGQFIGCRNNKVVCMRCGIEIFLAVKQIKVDKKAITGVLEPQG